LVAHGEATTSWKHHALVINCAIVPHLRRLGGIPFFPAGGGALIVVAKIFKESFRGNITIAGIKVNGWLPLGSVNFFSVVWGNLGNGAHPGL